MDQNISFFSPRRKKYTTIQKFVFGKIWCFLSLLCSPRLHLFDQKYSKNSNIAKYNYNLKWQFSILIWFKIEFISVIQS